MTLALPLVLALAVSAAPPPPPAVDWSRIPDAVGVSALTPPQKDVLARVLADEFCYCGCPHTLLGCLAEHKECTHAPRMGALAARLAGMGLSSNEILKVLTEYYASFDPKKRAFIDTSALGTPLGDPRAPITMVESHPGRVKLQFKPFPIAGHPHADTAAEAAEWARDQGIFWPFHDAMFDDPKSLDADSLASLATRLGKDGADLSKALASRKYRDRVGLAQHEGRRAGVLGTPTLFVNGRRHVIPDYSDTVLEFVLEDEEDWAKSRWKD